VKRKNKFNMRKTMERFQSMERERSQLKKTMERFQKKKMKEKF
jgi:hypothetical protein